MPVEDGQVLVEADVSQEVAGLLVPDAFHIPYKPLPCQIAIIDFTEYRPERDRVSVQELVPASKSKKWAVIIDTFSQIITDNLT